MDLIITILPVVTKDLTISPRFTPYDFLSRCKFCNLTTRQPMAEFYLLTFPRFPLRKRKHKSYFGKSNSRLVPHQQVVSRLPTRPLGRRVQTHAYVCPVHDSFCGPSSGSSIVHLVSQRPFLYAHKRRLAPHPRFHCFLLLTRWA